LLTVSTEDNNSKWYEQLLIFQVYIPEYTILHLKCPEETLQGYSTVHSLPKDKVKISKTLKAGVYWGSATDAFAQFYASCPPLL
jgi:hypothetical protein